MTSILREISTVEAQRIWPDAEEYLVHAVDDIDKEEFLRNLKAKVFAGMNTLWMIEDEDGQPLAYAVTVIFTPDGITKSIQIYMATGEDLDMFTSQIDQFTVWCIKRGVDFIEVVGRKGWEKVLRPLGFSHNYTSLLKRISEELH